MCNRRAGEGSSAYDGLPTSSSTILVWPMPAEEDAG